MLVTFPMNQEFKSYDGAMEAARGFRFIAFVRDIWARAVEMRSRVSVDIWGSHSNRAPGLTTDPAL
jgi:hypothetical protein